MIALHHEQRGRLRHDTYPHSAVIQADIAVELHSTAIFPIHMMWTKESNDSRTKSFHNSSQAHSLGAVVASDRSALQAVLTKHTLQNTKAGQA